MSSEMEQVARRYVRYHYGELLNAGNVTFNEKTNKFEAEIFSNYPRIIRSEEKPRQPWIKFLKLRNLGKVEFDLNMKVVSATSKPEMSQLVKERLTLYRQRAESIMVRASSMQFAKLTETIHVLNPIVKILNNLLIRTDNIRAELRRSDLQGEGVEIYQFLDLLQKENILQKTPSGDYGSGGVLLDFLEQNKTNPDKVIQLVLAYIIKQELPALKSAFIISQLEKHIRVDNSYYWQAFDAGVAFHAKWESLRERYITTYNQMISIASFRSTLFELQKVDAIKQENDGHYYANPQILGDMLVEKPEFTEGVFRRA